MDATFQSVSRHYLRVHSDSSGRLETVRAISRPAVPNSIIARRIVRRLGLTSNSIPSTMRVNLGDTTSALSTSEYVDLAFYAKEIGDCATYRFYVVEHCPSFDLLIGSNSTAKPKNPNGGTGHNRRSKSTRK